MTNRRELLKIGLAAAALPVAAHAALVETHGVPLYKVLYDTRFPASVAFARRAAAGGLAVRAMAGDMTPFWYDDLYHRWKQGPAAIAGLTAYGALFCLERLAWDQRMRVVYRGEHVAATAAAWRTGSKGLRRCCRLRPTRRRAPDGRPRWPTSWQRVQLRPWSDAPRLR